jgi:hypothetical protein
MNKSSGVVWLKEIRDPDHDLSERISMGGSDDGFTENRMV